jgi:short-subunit dehydrogenase
VVVITGASSGIGAAAARAFAARGCRLVLGARREERLIALRDALIVACGTQIVAARCDVRNSEDVERLVQTALDAFGRLDVIVLNAGFGLSARVEDTSESDFRDLIETNLLGVQRGIRAAVPVMRGQRSGHIVVVGSVVGKQSWPLHGAYAATKFGVTGLTRALRAELSGSGVTVSLVLPGSTRTEFFRQSKIGTAGYTPRPQGITQSAEAVAARIVRSVDHPAVEINTLPVMRVVEAVAEAFPALPDLVARCCYRWLARRLTPASVAPRSTTDESARTTGGTP